MNLTSILIHVRKMRDRKGLGQIINAAEARDSTLLSIESEKAKTEAWMKFRHLKKGDMVFIHVDSASHHHALWAKPLDVIAVRVREKTITVRPSGSRTAGIHKLTVLTCERLKLSKTPTPEALANGLQERALQEFVHTKPFIAGRRLGKSTTTINDILAALNVPFPQAKPRRTK